QNHGRSHALAPLRIGHADHGTVRNCGMFAQRILNLQRGYLVSTRFENVDVRPAKNAMDTVFIFHDRSIARAKPAVAEGGAGCLRLAPVFQKYAWTADFDLAQCARGNRLAVFSDKLNLDARQRGPDAARHALAP